MKEKQAVGIQNERIADIRKQSRLTQKEFADKIGKSADLIAKMESGKTPASIETAIRVSEVFGVSLDYIYGRTQEIKDEPSTMLLYLTKFFDYECNEENGRFSHTVKVKKCAVDFLQKYATAKKIYEETSMPDIAFNRWVDMLKTEFNDGISDENAVEYSLVPKDISNNSQNT